jgi:hypothetical protein
VARVTGFHACSREFAEALRRGERSLHDWTPSRNPYDWLGDGIYFWEGSAIRARYWATEMVSGEADVVQAEIDLGLCLDLMNTEYLDVLRETYDSLVELYREQRWKLPTNRESFGRGKRARIRRKLTSWLDVLNRFVYPVASGKPFFRLRDCRLRYLDRLVINQFLNLMESGYGDVAVKFQTVRCAFEEGVPIYPGSMIRDRTHVQVVVRDKTCILGVR